MATRHSRTVVFAGAFASLVLMSVLSAALGKVILGFIPKVCLPRTILHSYTLVVSS